ncbi:ba3d73eb-9666-49f4-97b0-8983da3d5756 [Sclerotinia trifoliorum]|uniref:Ba3d73eb-9666-49f4-97b0-8983da3d5756 n=1 Tax=Sclerotinia trifoliorum TaxID=28548 RepID=A0A8H2VNQ4_9HELO|nr:ba3d73eb-9666-49f4-97b0-8983da3d5756 [Sclerotinia trifoliorum]
MGEETNNRFSIHDILGHSNMQSIQSSQRHSCYLLSRRLTHNNHWRRRIRSTERETILVPAGTELRVELKILYATAFVFANGGRRSESCGRVRKRIYVGV